jgi:hypothetical protein
MKVELNEDEMACILVGLAEFEFIIEKKPRAFGVYKEINRKLVEKFRQRNWDVIQSRQPAQPTPTKKLSFLVNFNYDYYCQGTETANTSVLVHDVATYQEACQKIARSKEYENARDFECRTLL